MPNRRKLLLGTFVIAACGRNQAPSPTRSEPNPLAALSQFDAVAPRLQTGSGAVRVSFPATAAGPVRVATGPHWIEITTEQRGVARVMHEGRAIFANVAAATDAVWIAQGHRVEELRLLRDPSASPLAKYRVRLGPTLSSLRLREGIVEALDRDGRALLRTEPLFAVDARGERRTPRVELVGDELTVRLDVSGLTHPIAIDPAWGPTAAMAFARHFHAGAALPGGKYLVVGGESDSSFGGQLSSAEIFDPATNTWTLAKSMSTFRNFPSAAALPGGSVLVAGGSDQSVSPCRPASSAELYDPVTDTWKAAAPMLRTRRGAPIAAIAGGAVVVGGHSACPGGQAHSDGEKYDAATDKWTVSGNVMVDRRVLATATTLSTGKVLIAGGYLGNFANTYATTSIYDPASNLFSAGPAMATVRASHAAIPLKDGTVLIAGGYDVSGTFSRSSAEIFDPTTLSFTATAPLTTLRHNVAVAVLPDGRALVIGGFGSGGSGRHSTTEVYDPVAKTWSVVSAPRRRENALAFASGNRVFAIGGDTSAGATDSAMATATVDELADSLSGGSKCAGAGACTSGFCVDGVCCAERCDGICQTCAAVGSVGTCTSLTVPDPGKGTCGAYTCGAVTCKSSCLIDGDCTTGNFCNTADSTCKPKAAKGAPCTTASGCATGFCADSVCCDRACDGACETCNGSGSAGVCTKVPDGAPDPKKICTTCPCGATDAGTDTTAPGTDIGIADGSTTLPPIPSVGDFQRCRFSSECASGHCVEGVCCDTACTDRCYSCALLTSPGKCTVEPVGVDLKNECGPALQCLGTCDGTGQCIGAGTGTMCGRNRCVTTSGGVGPAYCAAPGGQCQVEAVVPFECAPYACEPAFGACLTTCKSSNDCIAGYVCALESRTCVAAAPPADEGGCTTAFGAPPRLLAYSMALLLALGITRRRRTH